MRQLLSNTIVGQHAGLNGFQINPDRLRLPVQVKLARAEAIFLAGACSLFTPLCAVKAEIEFRCDP